MSYDIEPRRTPLTEIDSAEFAGVPNEPAREAPGFIGQAREAFGRVIGVAMDALPTPPRKLTAGIAAGTLAFGLAPAVADAKIIPGKSIGGVSLQDTMAQVKATLGKPYSLASEVGYPKAWSYDYIKPFHAEIDFLQPKGKPARVDEIVTNDPKERTSKNIGAGSTIAEIRRAYPTATCKIGVKKQGYIANYCELETNSRQGEVVTDFDFGSGHKKSLVAEGVYLLYASEFK